MVFVLDSSGSMAIPFSMPPEQSEALMRGLARSDPAALEQLAELQRRPHPDSRLIRAKSLLGALIYKVADDQGVGVVRFSGECENITQAWAESADRRKDLAETIARSEPKGYTPLAESLNRAAVLLFQRMNEPAVIVVLSDGKDTCGGDPCAEARRIQRHQPGIAIHMVRLGGGAGGRDDAFACVAAATGGTVFRIDDNAAMQAAVLQATGVVTEDGKCK